MSDDGGERLAGLTHPSKGGPCWYEPEEGNMEGDKQDKVARAYATLTSLRKNVSEMREQLIVETYVREYHAVLDRLEGIGIDITEFRVPDSQVKPKITSSMWDDSGSHHSYSEEKYVDKPYLLTKIDSILSYFEIITSEKPRRIGFKS